MKRLIALILISLGVFTLHISAQKLLVNDEIPEDLLISLKTASGRDGRYLELSIAANGEISQRTSGGLPVAVSLPSVVFVNGKRLKNPKFLKPKLSAEKLKLLIDEFEKIQFFRFGEDFPPEDEKEPRSVYERGTEIISIRINGKFKEVSNYLGDSSKRAKILRDLAERIRGARVWNYENGEIPEVFEVWYRVNDGTKIERDVKIGGDGKVVERFFWEEATESAPKPYAPYPLKTKTVGRLSKRQLKELTDEFEKAVFSTFKYSPLSRYNGCANEAALNEHKRTHINVQINHVMQMYASLYADCNPLPGSDAAKFEYIKGVIERLLENLKDGKLK